MNTHYDNRNLKKLMKAFNASNIPEVHLGVLGDKNSRLNDQEENNASIGLKHEFGDDEVPVRSWLRVPVIDQMQKFLELSHAFDKATLRKVVKEGSLIGWMKKIGIVAEDVVFEGFNTGGFGKWTPSIMKYKKNHQTLVETQQLRNSVTSQVVE